MNKAISNDREALFLVSISSGLTLGYVFNLTFGVADIMSMSNENLQLGWLMSILYPILDTVALIPSLLIMVSLHIRKKEFTSIMHWLLLAISIVLVTVADIGFDYSERIGTSEQEEWFWNTLYSASYIVMVGALYWYYRVLLEYGKNVKPQLFKESVF